jgi:adenosylcobinamide kinase/adenosylcobinamide-phosphate guanylyltransferase
LTVVPATESGRRFADALGTLNQRLAATCDRVVLVIAGQPLTVKEQPPT